MTIKTYRGKSLSDALSKVKVELGAQAVILHTRTFRTGGWLGLGRRSITEITATSDERVRAMVAARSNRRVAAPPKPQAPPDAACRRAPVAGSRTPQAATVLQASPRAAPPETAQSSIKEVARLIVAASAQSPIEQEVAAIKRMVSQMLRSQGGQMPSMPEPLLGCYLRLLEAEVAREIADEIVGRVRDELEPEELQDPGVVQQAVLRGLSGHIQVAADAAKVGRAPDGRPLTIALVGPTGVGKTTTVAKLAATYRLRQGRRVGLITCDTFRIAAVEQLRTYADIIGLPLRVVMTPAEMRSACAALSECEVILIDTAGRAPTDSKRLGDLREIISAASPHQVHLVLSSASSEAALRSAAQRFEALGCDRLILTKLDEAMNFGVLVNAARHVKARLSFVTTGQEVPDQIEAGNADRLARLVMAGERSP